MMKSLLPVVYISLILLGTPVFTVAQTSGPAFGGFSNSPSLPQNNSQSSGGTSSTTQMCSNTNFATFADMVAFVVCIINRYLLPIVITLALILFFWGVAQFVLNGSNTEEREQGRTYMIWGILALFIMISFWGILKLLSITFGFGVTTVIPQFK